MQSSLPKLLEMLRGVVAVMEGVENMETLVSTDRNLLGQPYRVHDGLDRDGRYVLLRSSWLSVGEELFWGMDRVCIKS
jgi:hypothetical protein